MKGNLHTPSSDRSGLFYDLRSVFAFLVLTVAVFSTACYSMHLIGPVTLICVSSCLYFFVVWHRATRISVHLVATLIIGLVSGCILMRVDEVFAFPVLNHFLLGAMIMLQRYKGSKPFLILLALLALLIHLYLNFIMFISLLYGILSVGMLLMGVVRHRGVQVAVMTTLLGLVSIEMVLRSLGTYSGPMEQTFLPYYQSPYRESFFMRHIDDRIWSGVPNAVFERDEPEYQLVRTHNSMGVVDEERIQEKQAGTVRWVTAGDSFTENCCAPYSSSWSKLVESAIDSVAEFRFERVNQAFSGSDPVFEYHKFVRVFHKFQPDLVTLSVNTSDINDILVRGTYEFRYPTDDGAFRLRSGPWWETLYGSSYIVRGIVHDMFGLNYLFLTPDEYEQQQMEARAELNSTIDRFQQLAKEDGFRFLVIFHPVASEVVDGSCDVESAMDHAKLNDIPYLNLYDRYEAAGLNATNVYKYYYEGDGHHNERGNCLWAKCIYQDIAKAVGVEGGLNIEPLCRLEDDRTD